MRTVLFNKYVRVTGTYKRDCVSRSPGASLCAIGNRSGLASVLFFVNKGNRSIGSENIVLCEMFHVADNIHDRISKPPTTILSNQDKTKHSASVYRNYPLYERNRENQTTGSTYAIETRFEA